MTSFDLRIIPTDQIRHSISTPREHHDEAALERLAHWIRRRGLLQPILVRAIGAREFEVIAGERRLLAAQLAGLTELECRVRCYPDPEREDEPLGDVFALEDSLIENLVREGLSKLEESEAILNLVCLHVGETADFVVERLGAMHGRALKRCQSVGSSDEDDDILGVFAALNLIGWQAFYTHRVPLLKLPDEVKTLIHYRYVSYAAAKRIGKLELPIRQELLPQINSGTLRGGKLRRELDQLLGVTNKPANRLSRIRQALPKHLANPFVRQSLERLEQELGLL